MRVVSAKEFHQQRQDRIRTAREVERLEWLHRATDAIVKLAPAHPDVKPAYLFGSITMPGRFGPRSDIDVAVACDSVERESTFWRALEEELQRDVGCLSMDDKIIILRGAIRSDLYVIALIYDELGRHLPCFSSCLLDQP